MTVPLPLSPAPPLQPVLRRHLLQLRHGSTLLRPLLRSDLPAWRNLYEHVQRLRHRSCRSDAEDRFLAGVQRSRLQHVDDRLLLGVFDEAGGSLIGQLSIHLECERAQRGQLHWLCHALLMDATQLHSALQAACHFLFEQVGLHRLWLLLPPPAPPGLLTETLQATGFRQEGVLRGHHRSEEGWQDRYVYALTAPAWRLLSA